MFCSIINLPYKSMHLFVGLLASTDYPSSGVSSLDERTLLPSKTRHQSPSMNLIISSATFDSSASSSVSHGDSTSGRSGNLALGESEALEQYIWSKWSLVTLLS